MGKREDKIKYKSNKKGTVMLIVGIAVIVLLIVFIIFGTAIGDWVRNIAAANSADDSSTEYSSTIDTEDTDTDTESEDNGYPENETQLSPSYQLDAPSSGDTIAIVTTSLGVVKFKLFPDTAPMTVDNFCAKARAGYYNNMSFESLYADQAVQTGGDDESIYGGTYTTEFSINLHNYYGALGVSNSGNKDNTNQIYFVTAKTVADDILEAMSGEQAQATGFGFSEEVINAYAEHGGDPTLDGNFGVFGQAYEGYDVIDALNAVGADDNGAPASEIKIISIQISTY